MLYRVTVNLKLYNVEFLFTDFHWALSESGAVSGFDCISTNDGCIINKLESTWKEEVFF
jgi:hypothetical protein